MMTEARKSSSIRIAGAILVSAIWLAVLFELGSFLLLDYYVNPRDPAGFYVTPEIDPASYESYLANRHPALGWQWTSSGASLLDSSGSRIIPAFPETGMECVSIYGDSFTFGEDVENDDAWSNALSIKLSCRVANFGVNAYGTDQAFIRFVEAPADSSQIVVLGIFPHNVMRNVNQYRYFLAAGNEFGFKPRFVVTDNGLERIPLPDLSYEQLIEALSIPREYFRHEVFLPGSDFGPIPMSFPYARVLLRYVISDRVRYTLLGWPSWRGYMLPDHPSEAQETTVRIVEAFSLVAAERDKTTIVLLFPSPRSYKTFVNKGEIAYQHLLELVSQQGITVMDLHQPILDYLGNRSICDILTETATCRGHFDREGNALIADIVYRQIIGTGLMPRK